MARTRVIKKYPNRRLYDTEISSYITVEDIRQLVIDGENLEVHDAKTGHDLTRQVLLQIITDREDQGSPMLSTRMLQQLIRFYGDQLQGAMGSYLERSLQVFLEQQQQFRSQLNSMLGQTPLSMFQGMAERNLELFKQFQANALANPVTPVNPAKPSEPRKDPKA